MNEDHLTKGSEQLSAPALPPTAQREDESEKVAPRFPAELPQDCPLVGANPCEIVVYLACDDLTDTDRGFKTAADRDVYKTVDAERACMRHGLSVFTDIESCKHMQDAIPYLGKRIATRHLDSGRGVIRATEGRFPDHHTWWPFEGIRRSEGFSFA